MESSSPSSKMLVRVYFIYTWLRLKAFDQKDSQYSFGVIFDGILKFCIPISILVMTSSVAYVSRK